MQKGKLIIISGPSGSGKSTIREKIVKNNKNIWYSISMTTRKPRINEKNEIDYYFVTKEEFLTEIKNNNFYEYAEVYKDIFYGTPKNKVQEMLNKGYDVILEIDVDGALQIKKQDNNAILIFIMPPSIEELKNRLENRKTDSKEKIKERLNKALYEISFKDKYDYIVLNDDIEKATKEIETIIKKQN